MPFAALRARMRRRDAGSGRYVVTFAKGGARNLHFVINDTVCLDLFARLYQDAPPHAATG